MRRRSPARATRRRLLEAGRSSRGIAERSYALVFELAEADGFTMGGIAAIGRRTERSENG